MKLSIIIPCYNEAENIPLLLNRFSEVIKDKNIEVILVNNGSTDNSDEIISTLLPDYKFARSVLVPVNKGYGYGILQGLKDATGDYIGWTHADLQTDPGDVVIAYDLINDASEQIYVKGNRKGRSVFDTIFTVGMSIFESIYFGKVMIDINAQPNMFPKEFMSLWTDPPGDFSLDLYVYYLAKKYGLKILRFPVKFPKRIHGESKWNTDGLSSKIKFIKRTLTYSKELKHAFRRN